MTREPLYPRVHDWDNLLLAHRKAARGKRGQDPAARFEVDLADRLLRIQAELRQKTYRPWEDPYAQKHGRRGQPQAGVDVFGQPGQGGKWAGVQCKAKDDRVASALMKVERRRGS